MKLSTSNLPSHPYDHIPPRLPARMNPGRPATQSHNQAQATNTAHQYKGKDAHTANTNTKPSSISRSPNSTNASTQTTTEFSNPHFLTISSHIKAQIQNRQEYWIRREARLKDYMKELEEFNEKKHKEPENAKYPELWRGDRERDERRLEEWRREVREIEVYIEEMRGWVGE